MKDYRLLERVCKALGNARRLLIMDLLRKDRHGTVSEIARVISISDQSTSKHLQILERAGILVRVRRGMSVLYRLSPEQPEPAKTVLKLLS